MRDWPLGICRKPVSGVKSGASFRQNVLLSFLIVQLVMSLLSGGFASLHASGSHHELSVKDAAATVVVYNTKDPESRLLADFYCEARQIDPTHQIGVAAPLTEEISRADFEKSIEGPLLCEFVNRGYWQFSHDSSGRLQLSEARITYLVLMRGMPLKISPCAASPDGSTAPTGSNTPTPPGPALSADPASCNSASLDSELSVMGYFHHPINGPMRNPYCINESKPLTQSQIPGNLIMVARLDAPTADDVKRMISDGIRIEKEGLWGWGVTDLRSISEGIYRMGDDWIRTAASIMRQQGIPVLGDDLPETFQEGYPLTEVSGYYGWYAANVEGPFADPRFRFLPGALGFHIHSSSACTLRDPKSGWTGPLITHGAAASLGNVYEPYLGITTNLGTLARMLVTGHNLAESYYAAQPVLSWMSVLVGDPLYRPYARLTDPSALPGTKWIDYHRIILAHKGSVLDAAADLARRARELHESLYLEALGAAQYDAGRLSEAMASFQGAATLSKDPTVSLRLVLEQSRTLEKMGHRIDAISLLANALTKDHSLSEKRLLLNWMHRLDPGRFPQIER